MLGAWYKNTSQTRVEKSFGIAIKNQIQNFMHTMYHWTDQNIFNFNCKFLFYVINKKINKLFAKSKKRKVHNYLVCLYFHDILWSVWPQFPTIRCKLILRLLTTTVIEGLMTQIMFMFTYRFDFLDFTKDFTTT